MDNTNSHRKPQMSRTPNYFETSTEELAGAAYLPLSPASERPNEEDGHGKQEN